MNPFLGNLYNPDDALDRYDSIAHADIIVKGKKKHAIGDIIVIAGKKHIVVEEHGKIKYKYYGSGVGHKAKQHANQHGAVHKLQDVSPGEKADFMAWAHPKGFDLYGKINEINAHISNNTGLWQQFQSEKNKEPFINYADWMDQYKGVLMNPEAQSNSIFNQDADFQAYQQAKKNWEMTGKWGAIGEPLPADMQPSGEVSVGDSQGFKFVKSLGGSTGAQLVEKGGKYYVKKTAASPDHLRNEIRSLKYYGEMGVAVPKVEVYNKDEGVAYIEYIKGKTLKEFLATAPSAYARGKVLDKIKEHYTVDCLMGNWDVIGLDYDNIVVSEGGVPYRVDVGGSLEYRAMGEKKTESEWSENVPEVYGMCSKHTNLSGYTVFGPKCFHNIKGQLATLKALNPNCLTGNTEYNKVLAKRFNKLCASHQVSEDTASLLAKKSQPQKTAQHADHTSYDNAKYIDFFIGLTNSSSAIKSQCRPAATELFKKINDTMNFSNAEVAYIEKNWTTIANKFPSITGPYVGLDKPSNGYDGSVSDFASKNNMTDFEASAIRKYTGSSYSAINNTILSIVKNSEHGNIRFDDESQIKGYQVKTNEEAWKDATNSGDELMYIAGKLVMRGINKALQQGGQDVTQHNIVSYRNFGGTDKVESLKDVFKTGSVVAQCRASSKSYHKSGGIGSTGCKMKLMDKGLIVEKISQHDHEKEVLFPPFHPLKIEAAWVEPDVYGYKKLKVIASSVNDNFFGAH